MMKKLILVFLALNFGVHGAWCQTQGTAAGQPANYIAEDSVGTVRNVPRAAVIPFHDTLFFIYGNLGVVTVADRATFIERKIQLLEKDPFFTPDSLTIVVNEQNLDILYDDKVIVGITDLQARMEGKSKEEIASRYRDIIIGAIEKERAQSYWVVVLKRIGLAALVLAVTFFLIKLVNRLFGKLKNYVGKKTDNTIKSLHNLIDAEKQIKFATGIIKFFQVVAILLILYLCLLSFFRLFPETRWISDTLIDYLASPLKKAFIAIRGYIPNLFSIFVIVALFRLFIKGLRAVSERIAAGTIAFKGFHKEWAMSTFQIVRMILYVFMFILIFPFLPNSDSKIFQGVSVFMGVLFSLGSTSLISNMVSGLVITYMRPFKVGDRIKISEHLGNVIEKTSLVTRIRTPKNEVITIPNSMILTSQTTNYTLSANEFGLILYSSVTVGYEIQWRKVHELLVEAALKTPKVLQEPKPFVLQTALDDFYVQYQINLYTREANEMAGIYSNLNANIQDIFERESIELLSPSYQAHRDGSAMALPKAYQTSPDFKVPPININITQKQ